MPDDSIGAYVQEVGGRELAAGEWGLSVDGLEVGLRASRGLLRAQAWVAPAGSVDPLLMLHRNRSLELARYATTKAGDVWVVADVPLLDDGTPVDRLLGALVAAAALVRD